MAYLDEICDSFEDELRGGLHPEISTILNDLAETDRPSVVYELLRLELYYADEDSINLRAYLDRYPDYSDQIVAAFAQTNSGEVEERTVLDLDPLAADIGSGQIPEIENYELIRDLGSGGFADVYLALDRKTKRAVAIKVLKAGKSNPRICDSFVGEARILKSLSHPSIPKIHSIGRDNNGDPFVVMEFIKGQSFTSIMKDTSLDIRPKLEILAELAKVLDDVHQNGFYHRDVKPSNIIIGLDGDPNLVDFGLAIDTNTRRQGESEFAGTVSYMSPEQAAGNPSKASTDIWALGVILYQIISRQLPFRGDSPAKVIQRITKHEFEPPNRFAGNSSNEELEKICLKALSLKAHQRHASAIEFSNELKVASSKLQYEKVATTTFTGKESGVDQRLNIQAKAYSVRPERRQLPGFLAYLEFLIRSDRKLWTDKEREMMQRAMRYHLVWVVSVSVLMAFAVPWSYQTIRNRLDESHVDSMLDRLGDIELEEVESLIEDLHRFDSAAEKLRVKLEEAVEAENESLELRCRMALQKFDHSQTDYLLRQLTNAPLDQVGELQDVILSPVVLGNVDLSGKLDEIIESYPTVDGVENLWPVMPENIASEIRANGGMVEEAFAITPKIKLERFLEICELLRESRYRPIKARPFESGGEEFVAAIWHRDTRNWKIQIADNRADVSSRLSSNLSTNCVEQIGNRESYLVISSSNNSNELKPRYFLSVASEYHPDYFTDVFGLTDVFIEESHSTTSIKERYQQQTDLANLILEAKPWQEKSDKSAKGNALFLLGRALFYLGDYSESVAVLSDVISNYPHLLTYSLPLRAQAYAHLQKPTQANADRETLKTLYKKRNARADWMAAFFMALDCKLESFSGGEAESLERLDLWLENNEGSEACFYGACCYSAVAAIVGQSHNRERCIDRGFELLGTAVKNGLNPQRIVATADLEALRRNPRFKKFDVFPLRYRGKWNLNDKDSAVKFVKGTDFARHRLTVQAYSMAGFVPIAISVSSKDEIPAVSTVWRKTKWTEQCDTHVLNVANAACARLNEGNWTTFWSLLRVEGDCSLRTQLIHTIPKFDIPISTLVRRLKTETDVGVQQAILLAIGSYSNKVIKANIGQISRLANEYCSHADSGLHSAAKWLLSKAGETTENDIAASLVKRIRNWEINSVGQTMIRINGPTMFIAGSPENENGRGQLESLEHKRIGYSYLIAASESSRNDFLECGFDFAEDPNQEIRINWFQAAEYLNRLSEKEGIPESEWCYEPNENGMYAEGMKIRKGKLGYRLPTLNELRACRFDSHSAWFFGNTSGMIDQFGVVFNGGEVRFQSDTELKPSPYGFHGLVGCSAEMTDPTRVERVLDTTSIFTCGGSRRTWLASSRSASVMPFPAARKTSLGIRVTRTIRPSE